MSLLGIDLGTSGCKAAVFSEDGRRLSQAYREYATLYPRPGWAELDSQEVWLKTCEVIREAVAGVVDSSYQPAKVYPVLVGSTGWLTGSPKAIVWKDGPALPPLVSKETV